MLSIVFVVFWLRMEIKEFCDFREFQVAVVVHEFLKTWFVGFLRDGQILVEITIFAWIFAFNCFGYF